MIGLFGIVIVFGMVFGGYLAAGGKMTIIVKALPFELTMIGGAAIGAFLIANDGGMVKHTLKDLAKVFKGTRWKPQDYRDLLCLLFELIRLARQNPVALEEHIEAPADSAIFQRYPRILADAEAVALICDTLRSASMNYDDPHQVEEVLEKRMEANTPPFPAFQPRAAGGGRRPAGPRDRRCGARGHQDDGRDRPAAGDPRQADRRRAGRHLPRGVSLPTASSAPSPIACGPSSRTTAISTS